MEFAINILARAAEAILIGIVGQETPVEIAPFNLLPGRHIVRGNFPGSGAPVYNFFKLARYYKDGQLDLDSVVRSDGSQRSTRSLRCWNGQQPGKHFRGAASARSQPTSASPPMDFDYQRSRSTPIAFDHA